jgi:hypothetical protein
MFRFVGTFGGGFVVDGVTFGMNALKACSSQSACPYYDYTNKQPTVPIPFGGIDAYGALELGAELDIDHVLIDLGVEAQFQATGNITTNAANTDKGIDPGSIYGTRPIINAGPAVRIGYRFW